jgi:hypothetical protein
MIIESVQLSHAITTLAIVFKDVASNRLSLWRRQRLIVLRLNAGGAR